MQYFVVSNSRYSWKDLEFSVQVMWFGLLLGNKRGQCTRSQICSLVEFTIVCLEFLCILPAGIKRPTIHELPLAFIQVTPLYCLIDITAFGADA